MTATKCVLHITIIDMSVCCNDTDKKNKLVLFLELLSYVYTAVVDQVGRSNTVTVWLIYVFTASCCDLQTHTSLLLCFS